MRHTKIVATLGPASDADGVLDELVSAGVDVFRLNFSHGTHESHARTFERVRAAAVRAGRTVAVMQDLSGPKIRTGPLAGGQPLVLETGDELRIATGDFAGAAGRVSTPFAGLARSVRPGDRLLLADGVIELRVERTDGAEIETRVVQGGELGEHKGINAPGVSLPASALTVKDAEDLRFGLALGVDLVALSFVQSASDLARGREIMAASGNEVPLVAKLERPEAIERLGEVVSASDGVMVARGDLGLELPLEHVPRVQKEIVQRARARGVPVIVATQVLESMIEQARPTRAEVSDAATAVDEGVDAIMLAGETAIGKHPVAAVRVLDAIIRDAEMAPGPRSAPVVPDDLKGEPARALCEAAATLAEHGAARAIVAVTRGGTTARLLSAFRPPVPILAATDRPEIARRLALCRGVVPIVTDLSGQAAVAWASVGNELRTRGLVAPGALVVLISLNADLTRDDANFLKLHQI